MLIYPETLTVSSSGAASEKHSYSMGVYKITNTTHSDRPVWQSTERENRYIFYNVNGNNIFIFINILFAITFHLKFAR